jgi:hypothetical protein
MCCRYRPGVRLVVIGLPPISSRRGRLHHYEPEVVIACYCRRRSPGSVGIGEQWPPVGQLLARPTGPLHVEEHLA